MNPVKSLTAVMKPSVFQQAIYDFVESGKGSAVVIAVAGSGKTTTIVNAARLIPQTATASFVAFNKAIALELGERLPKHVRSQTLNAMGFGAWTRSCSGRVIVDSYKTRKIMDSVVPEAEAKQYAQALPGSLRWQSLSASYQTEQKAKGSPKTPRTTGRN